MRAPPPLLPIPPAHKAQARDRVCLIRGTRQLSTGKPRFECLYFSRMLFFFHTYLHVPSL